ncbi:portal protein [Bacillus phage vB_BceS_LY5]|uniref:portal protein n=1 Tax=Bacillus phage vB_BceS_LY5 TaxID=2996058 RepID=UPI0040550E73|nr:portal protein [Bacillus phage vB_BceS_LY5]
MGLLKNIDKTYQSDSMSTQMEAAVNQWRDMYKGYYSPFHDTTYTTVDGTTHAHKMKSLGMAQVVSSELASLMYNERCSISIDHSATEEFVNAVLNDNNFTTNIQINLEKMCALGGLAIKLYPSEEGEIRIGYASAEDFIPLASNGKIVTDGVFIADRVEQDRKQYILLEFHTWEEDGTYAIRNKLYETYDGATLNTEVALKTLQQYEDLAPETLIEDLEEPLFVYIKPAIPNKIHMNSPVGVSIFASALDTLEAIDTKYDSYDREFRLGKKRIIVPTSAVQAVPDLDGNTKRFFDVNDEVYEALNMETGKEEIKDISTELRVQQHIDAINSELELLAMRVGFSAGTFTFTSQGLKTATEVVSENSKTYRTRRQHLTPVEEGLKHLIRNILTLGSLYGLHHAPEDIEISINFDDSLSEDRDTNADYWIKLQMAGLAPKVIAIQKVLKVTEEEALEYLEMIKEDQAAAMPMDMTIGGEEDPPEDDEEADPVEDDEDEQAK